MLVSGSYHHLNVYLWMSCAGCLKLTSLVCLSVWCRRVGKWRVTSTGTFPQTPLRTGLDNFASSGSPELTHCLKNLFGFLHYVYLYFSIKLKFLTPFALWLAFPTALGGSCPTHYYGVSVAIGLAPRRRSRSTVMNDVIRCI